MAAQNPDDLIDFLSEREGASASRSPEPGPLAEIHADLETLKNRLSRPEPVDPFSDEPDCAGAVGRAADLASDTSQPTRIGPAGAEEGADEIQIAPAAEFPLGSLGKYQLIAKLGEGGMGTVYRARQIRLERLVALKVLPAARLKDPQAVARFEREMRAVGTLQHPHIVAAYDAGEIDGTHYLEMELVEGIDLGALAKNLGTLPIAEACELIRQAALGLQHAHEHALVHRDLKPSNLMLARTAEPDAAPIVKILDLGLALLEGGQIEGPRN